MWAKEKIEISNIIEKMKTEREEREREKRGKRDRRG